MKAEYQTLSFCHFHRLPEISTGNNFEKRAKALPFGICLKCLQALHGPPKSLKPFLATSWKFVGDLRGAAGETLTLNSFK